ncbi:MAG: DUF3467 domain-containing protein [Burkholderiales bacterium]|nr:DUF3467 domain-containing protein [Burkholderiales bacterium]
MGRKHSQAFGWDSSQVKSTYANVCNVTGTREEVVLDFGVYHPWERKGGAGGIELTNRVVLSPFAVKRLAMMLNTLTHEYEARYGKLDLDMNAAAGSGDNGGTE